MSYDVAGLGGSTSEDESDSTAGTITQLVDSVASGAGLQLSTSLELGELCGDFGLRLSCG